MYVDDILVTGNSVSAIDYVLLQLKQMFVLEDLGVLRYFLGIKVIYISQGMLLSQAKYVQNLLHRASGTKLSAYGGQSVENLHLYRIIVGALQYVTITRPKISFAATNFVNLCITHMYLTRKWSSELCAILPGILS